MHDGVFVTLCITASASNWTFLLCGAPVLTIANNFDLVEGVNRGVANNVPRASWNCSR